MPRAVLGPQRALSRRYLWVRPVPGCPTLSFARPFGGPHHAPPTWGLVLLFLILSTWPPLSVLKSPARFHPLPLASAPHTGPGSADGCSVSHRTSSLFLSRSTTPLSKFEASGLFFKLTIHSMKTPQQPSLAADCWARLSLGRMRPGVGGLVLTTFVSLLVRTLGRSPGFSVWESQGAAEWGWA